MTLVQDSIGVGGNALLGGRVKVVRARVVLVRRRELDRVLDVPVEDQALILQIIELERIDSEMIGAA